VALNRRETTFKHCYKWKDQQASMWARVKEEAKEVKQKWRGATLADGRCSPAVLDFLRRPMPEDGSTGGRKLGQ